MCFGCIGGSQDGVKEPLNSRVSGNISLPPDHLKTTTLTTSNTPYQPPNTSTGSNSTTNQQQQLQQQQQQPPSQPISQAIQPPANISQNHEKNYQDFTSLPIPEKENETTLTGWLFYRTGNVITTYEKGFFVLEDGYLYLYNQPKRSASSEKDLIHNPISLIGAILSKVSLPDRQFCIEIENKLFIDARTSANQVLWINALLGEIDVVSLNYLMSGNSSARDELALWFGKLLGRKQVCITVLQQSFLVTKHFMKAGFHRSHMRVMRVDQNGEKIVWGSPEEKDKLQNKDDNKNINLSSIIEVVPGASTQALSNVTNPTKAACCLTIYAEDRSLDVEMQDVIAKNLWVSNLNDICFVYKVIDAMDNAGLPKRGIVRRPSVLQRKANFKEVLAKNSK